jgi:hypothetical protein
MRLNDAAAAGAENAATVTAIRVGVNNGCFIEIPYLFICVVIWVFIETETDAESEITIEFEDEKNKYKKVFARE